MIYERSTMAVLLGEARDMVVEHHREAAPHAMSSYAPDCEGLCDLEAANALFLLLARDEGRIVGYVAHIVAPHPHHAGLVCAHNTAHYLAPGYRRGFQAIRLMKAAEAELRAMGVGYISYATPAGPLDRGPVFRFLGFEPVETIYAKALEN